MFGYFRPFDALVTVSQRHAFEAHYCRLCYCLRALAGQKARALTTFDAAIYSLIFNISQNGVPPKMFDCQKVRTQHVKYFSTDEVGMKFARLSFIAFGEKFHDDLIDGNDKKAKFMYFLYGKAIKKAQAAEPQIAQRARESTDRINELQAANATVEQVLDEYGQSMADTFTLFGVTRQDTLALYKSIAKWTFFVDMLCDYDSDFATNSPNSFRDDDCPTISDWFAKHYTYLLEMTRSLNEEILTGLNSIKNGSVEWDALYLVITHALNNVVPNILNGKDVTFHYVYEYNRNVKRVKVANKRTKLMNKTQKGK